MRPTPMLPAPTPNFNTPPPPLGTIPNGTISALPELVPNLQMPNQNIPQIHINYPFQSPSRLPMFTQPQLVTTQSQSTTTTSTIQPQLQLNPHHITSDGTTHPKPKDIIHAKPQNKANKAATKIADEDVKSHALYKNLISQIETCRGINVQLSTKNTRLEETVRILETKNLYQQEEIQRLKGINEGISNSNNGGQTVSCITRVGFSLGTWYPVSQLGILRHKNEFCIA